MGEAGTPIARLFSHEEVLVQIALPDDDAQPEKLSGIQIAAAGGHGKPVTAIYVSSSPQTDSTIQGRTYFFRAPAHELRAGMRVEARVRMQGEKAEGVIVPGSAVVWYAGKAWVYRKEGQDRFLRTLVSTAQETGEGWFNTTGFKQGDEVVTSGTQLLLSEEFKYQIKNENQD
jgi:hypothetical protein